MPVGSSMGALETGRGWWPLYFMNPRWPQRAASRPWWPRPGLRPSGLASQRLTGPRPPPKGDPAASRAAATSLWPPSWCVRELTPSPFLPGRHLATALVALSPQIGSRCEQKRGAGARAAHRPTAVMLSKGPKKWLRWQAWNWNSQTAVRPFPMSQ